VVTQIARALPAQYTCIARTNVSDAQRALLHVFAGIVTTPAGQRDCDVLLVQGERPTLWAPGAGWDLIWEGARSGDKKERFRLYRRT
jgi:hypothetical protein